VVIRADAAQRAARRADEPAIGRLGIGYLPDALPATVPRLLRASRRWFRGIRVSLETGAARPLLESVRGKVASTSQSHASRRRCPARVA